jgi:hypothetical protein
MQQIAPADRLVTLPPGIPELTLGWEAIRWATTYLRHPDGPRAGERWDFIESQARFLLWWYAIGPDGRWLFEHGVRRLSKGSGKSPFAGVVSLIELLAPVRLAHFDANAPGGVVGKPVAMPLVQIAATAESQTANTMRVVRALTAKNSKVVREYGLDPGKTIIYTPNGGELQVITSSAAAAEGALATFTVEDEALSLGTVIPTPEGWTTVGDIQVGDRVFGTAGPCMVTHVTPVFTGRPCYRVTFEDGSSLVADAGHLWTTRVISSAALPRVRTTQAMAEDGRRFAVPRLRPFDAPDLDLPVDPYVLGLWLGDGSSRWAALTVGIEDLDFVLSAVRARGIPAAHVVKSGRGRAPTVSLSGDRAGRLYTKDGSSVRGALVKLGVLGNKHIPADLLRASLRQRLDLLRGLMDSDGHVNPATGSATFVSGNERLANDMLQLARSLGLIAAIRSRVDDRWAGNPVIYKVVFRPDTDLNPFLLPRKAIRVKAPSARRWKTIRTIERIESVRVKCIEVDSEDHLFVAGDGWTLTHNTEHWKPSNGGPALAETIDRNLAKSNSRAMETSNAWEPGDGSVAEATFDAWVAQEERRTRSKSKILYDARVAPADTQLADEASLRAGIAAAYGDCWWVDQQTIMDRVLSLRTKPDTARRFYLNQPVASADAWVTQQEWALLSNPAQVIADGDEIVAFFDGSKTRDATALIGCHVETGHVFCIDVWEPEPGPAHRPDPVPIPVGEVDAAVQAMFDRWDVRAFFADVREWESFTKVTWPERYADQLEIHAVPAGKEPQPIAWDMRTHVYDFTMACELTLTEITEMPDGVPVFTHDGDSRVGRHMINCRRHPNRWGLSVAKESRDSPKKIDAAVCVIGARMVRRLLLAHRAAQPARKPRSGKVYGFA